MTPPSYPLSSSLLRLPLLQPSESGVYLTFRFLRSDLVTCRPQSAFKPSQILSLRQYHLLHSTTGTKAPSSLEILYVPTCHLQSVCKHLTQRLLWTSRFLIFQATARPSRTMTSVRFSCSSTCSFEILIWTDNPAPSNPVTPLVSSKVCISDCVCDDEVIFPWFDLNNCGLIGSTSFEQGRQKRHFQIFKFTHLIYF